KGKAMEEDEDEEEAIQRYKQELFNDKLLVSLLPPPMEYYVGDVGLPRGAKISGGRKGEIMLVLPMTRALVLSKNGAKGVGVRTQLKWLLAGALVLAKHVKLVQAAKAFLEGQEKPLQFFILEGYKGKGKLRDVDSNSEAEEEEDQVHKIKRIKRKHVEKKLTGARMRKETADLDEVKIVEPRAPVAGPLCLASKPIIWVPHVPRPISRSIITLVLPVAAPSSLLVVNQASKVPDTQGTLHSDELSEEDAPGDKDDSDSNDHATRDDNSARRSEGAQSAALRTMISEVKAPVSVPTL
ncbi:hypothetical protein C0995_014102, partial [Termitomyces sp. Mi166